MKRTQRKLPSQSSAMSRRRFLGQASCAAVGSTAMFSSLLNLGMANSAVDPANFDDYRALICLFLAGGNDSFNMLVPRGSAEYAEYQAIRSDLALPQGDLLPITPATSDGKSYGLHPAMPEVKALFDDGKLAFVNNVGTLVEPITLPEYHSGLKRIPLGLYSHADQIGHWQTCLPDQRSAVGWGGRIGDLLQNVNSNSSISMNISLSGSNVFQAGNNTIEYAISSEGSVGVYHYGDSWLDARLRTDGLDNQLDYTYANVLEQFFATKTRNAIDSHLQFSSAVDNVTVPSPFTTENEISQSFRMIAKTIGARDVLGMKRQTFYVLFGGWDHHDEVLNNQNGMLAIISQALSELYTALDTMGVADKVTTFTASDFGRTLTSNGQGSDHAWGGNHMVMGAAVNGGDFYGSYPDLYEGNPLDTGRGRLIPTTSVDEYFAELACWFGVSSSDLALVLPNIGRFYSPGSSTPPLGFMSQT